MLAIEVTRNEKYNQYVVPMLHQIRNQNVIARIWNYDHTVWKQVPTEIENRLGWLYIADELESHLPEITTFVDEVRYDEYTHVVLLGMGGSSLASDVFQRVFHKRKGYLKLSIL